MLMHHISQIVPLSLKLVIYCSDNNACIITGLTLQPMKTIYKPDVYKTEGAFTTITLCGDGLYFYWIWCPGTVADKNAKGQSVYLEVFRFDVRI